MKKPETEMRQKYLDTLERLEVAEARWERLESVLRLTVGRLCLAARGRSSDLDAELRTLADVMRRQPEPDEIEACLETLSRAVASLDEPRAAEAPGAGSAGAGRDRAPPAS
ncbi:MAG: hypothetical protein ACREUG_17220, partial [Steroidobacteraceae bacterium]